MAQIPARLTEALHDRYVLERELGHGGMATVYLARDLKHERPVALKLLHPDLAAALGPERFIREIRLTARLDHPHILPVFDSGEASGQLWYTMPYVEGESLRERLRRDGQLPLEEVFRLTDEIADALDSAHQQGVVHRDIKPENILLARGHARVADFGVARALEAAGGDQITATGLAVGTPAYMSPEQANDAAVDARSDVYALGCVVYEMLAGEAPYAGPTAQSIIAKRFSEPIPRLSTLRAVTPGVEAAVTRALALAPADRFSSAGAFAAAVRADSTSPARGHPHQKGARWIRPSLLALAVGLLALVALGGYALRHRAAPGREYQASIAILPFVNVGGNPGDEYFSEGMTDEIITQLAQVQGLKVISRVSVVALKDRKLTLPQIADTLGVRHVVEGTIRRTGDSVRVNVQLVDARSDTHLWAASYDRPLRVVFGLQEEIAREVSTRLLGSGSRLRPLGSASRTEETAAYDAYLEGNYWLQRRTPEGFARALGLLEEAVRRDSTFAPAHAALSGLYSLCIVHFGCPASMDPDSAPVRAVMLAERAIALDPELADGYAARGYAALSHFGLTDIAIADLERALTLRPNSGQIHIWYAVALAGAGRIDDALAAARTANTLDPLSPGVRTGAAAVALVGRQYELSLSESRRAQLLEPALLTSLRWIGLALLELGRSGECTGPSFAPAAAIRAACLRAVGRTREATAIMDSLERDWDPRKYFEAADIAKYYAIAGHAAAAAEWYRRSRGIQVWFLPSELYDPVRRAPEFRQAVERIQADRRELFNRSSRQARAR